MASSRRRVVLLADRIQSRIGRLSRRGGGLPAGVIDAGFASLGTFVAGLAAVNLLSDTNRGVYGVFFAAFVVGTTFPHNLVYLPSQVFAVGRPLHERMNHIGRVTLIGMGFSALGAGAIIVAALATFTHTTAPVILALTTTGVASVAVSASQDNLRRMLHVCEFHWTAAAMSIVQFVTVGAVILIMIAADIPIVWMPFGSLFIANIVSSAVGLVRAGGLGQWEAPDDLAPKELVRSGRWLLGQALIPTGATFLGATLITTLAGAEAMGYAESARVVAQPVLVMATGLTAVLGPRVMAAAIARDNDGGKRLLKRFEMFTVVPGLLYVGVAGWLVPWNPMAVLVPSAYVVAGLAAATILANVMSGSVFLRVEELMGARREVDLVKVSSAAAAVMVGISFTAGVTGAFARPLGLLGLSGVRYTGYAHYRRQVYESS